jgi:hypothetical protein
VARGIGPITEPGRVMAALLLSLAVVLTCFGATIFERKHAGSRDWSGRLRHAPRTAEWASLRLLHDDLLTLCGPRERASETAENRRLARTISAYCRRG